MLHVLMGLLQNRMQIKLHKVFRRHVMTQSEKSAMSLLSPFSGAFSLYPKNVKRHTKISGLRDHLHDGFLH